jgi:hypothetical protein
MWNWYPRGIEDALELVQKGREAGRGNGHDGIDLLEAFPCVQV